MFLHVLLPMVFCLVSAARTHIRNGHDAPKRSYPWLLRLGELTADGTRVKVFCGANLIRLGEEDSSDIAITAAHCINQHGPCYANKEKFTNKVVFYDNHPNDGNLYRQEKMMKVVNGFCHDGWNPHFRNRSDIAVLKLEKPIRFTTGVVSGIDLPKKGDVVKEGANCTIGGWGANHTIIYEDNSESSQYPTKLQKLDVQIASDETCFGAIRDLEYYKAESSMCEIIDPMEGHVLGGDSGSGLICHSDDTNDLILQGVAVNTMRQLGSGIKVSLVDIYEEVIHYIDWIQERINELSHK